MANGELAWNNLLI